MQSYVLTTPHLDVMHCVALSIVLEVDRVLGGHSLLSEVIAAVVDRLLILMRDLLDRDVVVDQVVVAVAYLSEDMVPLLFINRSNAP